MDQQALDFLERLMNAPSPSGFEQPAAKLWREYVGNIVMNQAPYLPVRVYGDTYGNSVACMDRGTGYGRRIMLCGHIDEVGFMVNHISEAGYIYLSAIGGVDPAIVAAQRIVIHGKNGPVCGVFGKTAIHLMDKESKEAPKLHQMFVDIGAKDKEDALKLVSVGDPAVFDISFKQLPNNRAVGRGFDDRVGAWCVAETLRKLGRSQTAKNLVYGVATVQEENGMFGAEISAFNVKPEVAIAIDVTHATDSPGISKERCGEIKLGTGPSIGIGSVANPKLNALLVDLAEKKQIPLQREARPRRSGTDADAIFRMLGGVPTANVSIPNRYMHTPVEMVCLDDLDNAVSLLTELCEAIDGHDFVV